MAKIQEEVVVIKLSKLIKDTDSEQTIASEDLVSALQSVVEELSGPGIVVEVDKA